MATAIMKQKEVPEMDDVEEIISKISEESPYRRRPTQKRTWMTVPEMGKLLGLKKTDRYWLVHKNVFESKEIAGKIRINIANFYYCELSFIRPLVDHASADLCQIGSFIKSKILYISIASSYSVL